MDVKRRATTLALVLSLALALVMFGSVRAVAVDSSYGVPAQATVDLKGNGGLAGFKCKVAAVWETTPEGLQRIWIDGYCENGKLAFDRDVVMVAKVAGCGDKTYTLLNLSGRLTFSGQMLGGSTEGCGASLEFCAYADSDGVAGSKCTPWTLGAPPGAPDPEAEDYYGSGPEGCTQYTPLEPWITEYAPVAVTGGWAWRSTMMIAVPWTRTPAYPILDGNSFAPYLLASVTGAVTVTSPDGSSSGPQGTGRWISARYWTSSGNPVAQHRTIIATGPTHTGTTGSVPLDWQWRGGGLYWSTNVGAGDVTANVASHPLSYAARPTASQIASQPRYGAHHDPERCHFWWGTDVWPSDTSGYDAPAGPLNLRANPTPPAEPPPPSPPPVIHVGPEAECPSGADVCIDPDEDPDPSPSVPDPGDESCDFSITNPSTWGGQIICALAAIAGAIIDAIMGVLDFLGGLLAALLDLLTFLFVPTGDGLGGSMDSMRAMWDDGAGGQWAGVFQPPEGAQMRGMGVQSFGASSASGSCEGPTVDIGSLGLDSDVINIEPMQPFAACSGTTATVAENVRMWTGVGLVLGGGFKIFEMILGAFGAMRQVRIMSDHDWSGRR